MLFTFIGVLAISNFVYTAFYTRLHCNIYCIFGILAQAYAVAVFTVIAMIYDIPLVRKCVFRNY
jgi:hypothetical protein